MSGKKIKWYQANTKEIKELEKYEADAKPRFLFYRDGEVMEAIEGINAPAITRHTPYAIYRAYAIRLPRVAPPETAVTVDSSWVLTRGLRSQPSPRPPPTSAPASPTSRLTSVPPRPRLPHASPPPPTSSNHPRCCDDHCPEGNIDIEEVAEDAGGEDEDD